MLLEVTRDAVLMLLSNTIAQMIAARGVCLFQASFRTRDRQLTDIYIWNN